HAAMLQANNGILSERHQIRKQKTVAGFNLVLAIESRLRRSRADGMAHERQCHIEPAPIIAAAAPLFGPGALRLRRQAVIKKEPRIALQSSQISGVRKDERCAGKMSGPISASFRLACIEQQQI